MSDDVRGRFWPGIVVAVAGFATFVLYIAGVIVPVIWLMVQQKLFANSNEAAAAIVALFGPWLLISHAIADSLTRSLTRSVGQRRADHVRWLEFSNGLTWYTAFIRSLSDDEYEAYERGSDWFGLLFPAAVTTAMPAGILTGHLELWAVPFVVMLGKMFLDWRRARQRLRKN